MSSKLTAVGLLLVMGLAACTSSTVIHSNPPGAKVYIDGTYAGVTPYTMSDTKIVSSTTQVRLEQPGYHPTVAVIHRSEAFDVGACIGGVFLLVPFLWIMGYHPTHTYEMDPAGPPAGGPPGEEPPPAPGI